MPVNLERGKIWVPPGTYEGEHLADPRSRFPRYPFPYTSALGPLQKHYTFFTLGIPIKLKTFNDAYLHDLASILDNKFRLYICPTRRAFFRHLEIGHDRTYNFTLFAVERRYWKEVSDFFVSVGLLDRVINHYHKYNEQEFIIPDPNTGGPGTITLHVTAVNSTKGQFVGRRSVDGIVEAIKLPCDPYFVRFAQAVLAGHPNPMSLLEDNKFGIPDKPFVQPQLQQMNELTKPVRSHVIKSIEEINSARQRGEFPEIRGW